MADPIGPVTGKLYPGKGSTLQERTYLPPAFQSTIDLFKKLAKETAEILGYNCPTDIENNIEGFISSLQLKT